MRWRSPAISVMYGGFLVLSLAAHRSRKMFVVLGADAIALLCRRRRMVGGCGRSTGARVARFELSPLERVRTIA